MDTVLRFRMCARRGMRAWLSGFVLLMLAGCAGVFIPAKVSISEAEMLDRLAKRFPLSKSYFGLAELKLMEPHLKLNGQSGRVETRFNVELTSSIATRTLRGTLAVSGKPRFDDATQAVFLSEARVELLKVDGLPEALAREMTKAANGIAIDALEREPVYRFKPEQLKYFGQAVRVAAFTVVDGQLIAELARN